MRREKLGQFTAAGSDGVEYVVKMFRMRAEPGDTFEVHEPSSDPGDWEYVASVPGVDRGHQVGRVQKGKYKFVDADITLTSTDPAAP